MNTVSPDRPTPRAVAHTTFATALRDGFWACERCGAIALEIPALAVDPLNDNLASCPRCHKRAAAWHPPTLS